MSESCSRRILLASLGSFLVAGCSAISGQSTTTAGCENDGVFRVSVVTETVENVSFTEYSPESDTVRSVLNEAISNQEEEIRTLNPSETKEIYPNFDSVPRAADGGKYIRYKNERLRVILGCNG